MCLAGLSRVDPLGWVRYQPLRNECDKGVCPVDKTITRADLTEALYEKVGLSRNESADLVESIINHVSDALVDGEQVKVASFGTFLVREKAKRIGRNPKTGEEHEIPPRRVLVFRASQVLKQALVEDWKGGPLDAYIEDSDDE